MRLSNWAIRSCGNFSDKTNNFAASQHVRAASQWVRQSVKWVTPLCTSVITQTKVPCPSACIQNELCHILSAGLAWVTPLNTVIWYAESLCALTTTPVSPYVHFRLVCENKTFPPLFRSSIMSEWKVSRASRILHSSVKGWSVWLFQRVIVLDLAGWQERALLWPAWGQEL